MRDGEACGMITFQRGRWRVREVRNADDLAACLALRSTAFPVDRGGVPDPMDALCRHLLIEEIDSGIAVCTCRLLRLKNGAEIDRSYSAAFYDLQAFNCFPGPLVELGRFCIRPGLQEPDILRLAWGALSRIVDKEGIEIMFGCSSFAGTDAHRHAAGLGLLSEYLAPERWRPRRRAPEVVCLTHAQAPAGNQRRAMLSLPPLLRAYLLMGGRVGDHAVVDAEMGTLHVFTGLEIRAIPPQRARLLRAAAREPAPDMERR